MSIRHHQIPSYFSDTNVNTQRLRKVQRPPEIHALNTHDVSVVPQSSNYATPKHARINRQQPSEQLATCSANSTGLPKTLSKEPTESITHLLASAPVLPVSIQYSWGSALRVNIVPHPRVEIRKGEEIGWSRGTEEGIRPQGLRKFGRGTTDHPPCTNIHAGDIICDPCLFILECVCVCACACRC